MPDIFTHVPHPRIAERRAKPPAKVKDQLPRKGPVSRFNAALAVRITNAVGTMWCAYAFAAIALIGLGPALKPGGEGIIAWIAQTFLQLVLLSIIIVGQNVQSAAADKRSEATYEDADAVLHEALQIEAHLQAQDAAIERILAELSGSAGPRPAIPDGPSAPGADPPPS